MTKHKLKVALDLTPAGAHDVKATVTVTITDTCYKEGALQIGLPPHTEGIPEIEYLSFYFTHAGGICGQVVRDVSKSLEISLSSDKREVTAFAVVNDEVAGHVSHPVPSI